MSSLARSKALAVCAVGGSIATAGYMYIAGKQTKAETLSTSPYNPTEDGVKVGGTDSRLGSKGVRETVQGERKP